MWALALVVSSACQSVLGDFTIAPAPPALPPVSLGTVCEPGAYRCTNEVLETCSDDRSKFVAVATCANANECNLNTRSCRPCTVGEFMCRGQVLEQCDPNGAWLFIDTCETAALCDIMPDHRSGECATPVNGCATGGEHRCSGATLERCSEGRDAFERVALCENPELCDAAHADELALTEVRGACKPPACAPDSWSCEGATLRHCAIDRTQWDDVVPACDSPDLCSARSAGCGPCEPEQIECNGAELRRCRASGGWETLEVCKSGALCDAEAGRCLPAECATPGLLRCINNDGVPSLERCSEDFAWEVAEVCVTLPLCSVTAGRCLAPACGGGAVRCNGDRHETCSPDRTRWVADSPCAAGQLCHPELGCIAGPCTDGNVRCNGSSLERCASARFEESVRCETPELCDELNQRCNPPVCPPPPAFVCTSTTNIKVCRPGRDGLDDYLYCTMGTCVGKPQCELCPPNVYECDQDQDLVRCSSDGQARVKVRTCTTCDASSTPPICN